MAQSFYWHDYETWGIDPRRDRPAQFAGIRTDESLAPIGDPLVVYCNPPIDRLPSPESVLITGVTPQKAEAKGVCEAEFMQAIHRELATPGTCGVGYNSIRFDDEVTRHGFYRNFIDPYAREWKNGGSRWDIIDMVRLTRALRPQGIEWPLREDGTTSFRLELLTQANGIVHSQAHDALSDVRATIELARLVRKRQPKLYAFLLDERNKKQVAKRLDLRKMNPVVHVSSRYPARHGCLAVVVPVANHPVNKNGIIVYDLRFDPESMLDLDVATIERRLFTPKEKLSKGELRIPLKTIHINRCPVVVPINTLTEQAIDEWEIDITAAEKNLGKIQNARGLAEKISEVYTPKASEERVDDPDFALYSGGFFCDQDRREMDRICGLGPEQLKTVRPEFKDARLPEMLFRYRARNWPDSLSAEERQHWREFCRQQIATPKEGALSLAEYRETLARLSADHTLSEQQKQWLSELKSWGEQIGHPL